MSDFTISKIEPQKKSKNRFSIFSGSTFKIGVSTDTLIKFGLKVGKKISTELLLQIRDSEDYIALKNSALRYLARRPHSIKELKDKLFKKSKNISSINRVIEECLENKYLDDSAFAVAFLSDEIRLKKSGPLLIKNKLLSKGVQSEIIDQLLITNYSESEQFSNCAVLAEKKINSVNPKVSGPDKKSKVVNYLKQKGYHWESIRPVIDSLKMGDKNEE